MTFEEFVRSRGPALVRLARLLTGDHDRAEDLVQEVLGRAFGRWRAISRTERPEVYVHRMLLNANSSWWRKNSNREQATPTETITAVREVDREIRLSVDDLSTRVAETDEVWRLIACLPRQQRSVLVLRYYEDLDDTTIGEILECSPSTVRTHAMRAIETLRLQLQRTPTGGTVTP